MKHAACEKRKAQVIQIWEKHYPNITVEDVTRLTGQSYRTIYRYLQEAGQPLPPKKPTRTIDKEKVKQAHALYRIHKNKAKVARIMKMSRRHIYTYLKMEV